MRDKVTRQCLQTTTLEENGEPKRNRTEVPLLTSLTAMPDRLWCGASRPQRLLKADKAGAERHGVRHVSEDHQILWAK